MIWGSGLTGENSEALALSARFADSRLKGDTTGEALFYRVQGIGLDLMVFYMYHEIMALWAI